MENYPVKIMGGTLYHVQVPQLTFCDDIVDLFIVEDGEPSSDMIYNRLLDYYNKEILNGYVLSKEEKDELVYAFTYEPVVVAEEDVFPDGRSNA